MRLKLLPLNTSRLLPGVKNDNNDAEATCEAAQRPRIHTIPVKSPEQLGLQSVHRIRELAVKERTRYGESGSGILSEFGLIVSVGKRAFERTLPEHLKSVRQNGLS